MEPVKEFRFDEANLVKVQAGISNATVEVAPAHESTEHDAPDDMVCLSIQREADIFSSVGLTPMAALQVAAALVHAVTKMLPKTCGASPLVRQRNEIDPSATSVAFFTQAADRGDTFAIRYHGLHVDSVNTRESDGMGSARVPKGARFVEIDDAQHEVLFT